VNQTKRNDEIRLLYEGQWTMQEIANRYRLSRQRVYQILDKMGVATRSVGEAMRLRSRAIAETHPKPACLICSMPVRLSTNKYCSKQCAGLAHLKEFSPEIQQASEYVMQGYGYYTALRMAGLPWEEARARAQELSNRMHNAGMTVPDYLVLKCRNCKQEYRTARKCIADGLQLRCPHCFLDMKAVKQAYLVGESLFALSARFECSPATIRNILVREGVRIRTLAESRELRKARRKA